MTLEELKRLVEQKKSSLGVIANWDLDGLSHGQITCLGNLVESLPNYVRSHNPRRPITLLLVGDGEGHSSLRIMERQKARDFLCLNRISKQLPELEGLTLREMASNIRELVRLEVATEADIRQALLGENSLEDEFFSRRGPIPQ